MESYYKGDTKQNYGTEKINTRQAKIAKSELFIVTWDTFNWVHVAHFILASRGLQVQDTMSRHMLI